MKKILILGGMGYIGSRLYEDMNKTYEISSWDICKYSTTANYNTVSDYSDIQVEDIARFDVVIVLAGHSSVRMCDGCSFGVMKNNVFNLIRLSNIIRTDQTLIYASSASVYGNCTFEMASEETEISKPYNMYDMTKQIIDSYMITSGKLKNRVFGLRFGTVNGYSPIMRDDVMLNSMTNSAWNRGCVDVFNPNTKRSILAISDLVRAICVIIESDKIDGGLYNLASFASTSGNMAQSVATKFSVDLNTIKPIDGYVIRGNEKIFSSNYNFSLDCSKFKNDFGFEFSGSIESIIDELNTYKGRMVHTNRNAQFDYEWRKS